jgi:hypothetical protein
MTIRSISALFLLGVASVNSPLAAQDKKIAEPETIGVLYYIDSVAGSLVPLERQVAKTRSGIRALSAQINDEKSPVRLTSQTPEFVVRLAAGVDPTKFKLTPFTKTKGKRELKLATLAGVKHFELPCEVTKFGESSYKIKAAKELVIGEYGFSANDSNEVFAFGIDLSKN